jgi:N-carbamoyl-L-amino-acid hydrolase
MGEAFVDDERLFADVMALGAITDPHKAWTRRAFTDLFLEGRAFIRQRMEAAGLTVHIDAAGNMIGRADGTDPSAKVIAVGSHSDTVPAGGRFDGIAGVLAGVEVARALHEAGERLRHPLEIIDFLAEEPSDFGLSCIGSRGLVGALDQHMLEMKAPDGRVLGTSLEAMGGDQVRALQATRSDFAAFLELHIEQGPMLEAEGLDIGVVSSIVGIRRIEIVFEGQATHAGTAPMHLRQDAAVAGAQTVLAVREIAEKLALAGEGYFVATVGIMQVEPGGSNVVPGRCRIVIDARAEGPALTDRFTAEIDAASLKAAETFTVRRASLEVLSDGVAALCDPGLMDTIKAASDELGYSSRVIASGAGHDAAFMARVCPSAMIFIPCLKGLSHHPDEWASRDQCAKGTAVLLRAVQAADKNLGD